jgi:hypothetical protein
MAYSNYNNLKKVEKQLGLKIKGGYFFSVNDIVSIEPSAWLLESLKRAKRQGYDSEKERSERIVWPILSELSNLNDLGITIYSGHELNVDKSLGLNGECDFLLALGQKVIQMVQSPLFSVVEAKRQDLAWGTAQCAAQMVGVLKFNELEGKKLPYLYGATTDGVKWNFLKLEDDVLIVDQTDVLFGDIPRLLGILQFLLDDCKKFGII